MPIKYKRSLCWLRRDLRLHDQYALAEALKNSEECFLVFIFDSQIKNQQIPLINQSLYEMEEKLNKLDSSIIVKHGDPIVEILKLSNELNINAVYFNREYEPKTKQRDLEITKKLHTKKIDVFHFKDQVHYEQSEIRNGSNEIYKVFTPYKNKWLETFYHQEEGVIPNYHCNFKHVAKIKKQNSLVPLAVDAGTKKALNTFNAFKKHIDEYKTNRDFPALNGTSGLSAYLRFGNLSVRDMLRLATHKKSAGFETWLAEIIWRDFYHMILDSHPYIEQNSFKPQYDKIVWPGSMDNYNLWCQGQTGYPIIDSAMRSLNQTGLMHNRLRMVVASFLTKTLLIDWRLGEKYFSEKLLDYDLAANNGGWQWSASTGVDAQPYFRIFNPYNQSTKFDADGIFIRCYCPELSNFSNKSIHAPHETDIDEQAKAKCIIGKDYPHPIVAYKEQKVLALKMFQI